MAIDNPSARHAEHMPLARALRELTDQALWEEFDRLGGSIGPIVQSLDGEESQLQKKTFRCRKIVETAWDQLQALITRGEWRLVGYPGDPDQPASLIEAEAVRRIEPIEANSVGEISGIQGRHDPTWQLFDVFVERSASSDPKPKAEDPDSVYVRVLKSLTALPEDVRELYQPDSGDKRNGLKALAEAVIQKDQEHRSGRGPLLNFESVRKHVREIERSERER